MKRFLVAVLLITMAVSFASCTKDKKNNTDNTETTSNLINETEDNSNHFTVDVNGSQFKIDQKTMMIILDAFPKEVTGLKEPIENYRFNFSEETFHEIKGCKAEAYIKSPKKIEGVFLIIGNEFYVYDETKKDYMLLTEKGRVEVEAFDEVEKTTIVDDNQKIEDNNDKVLHKKFKGRDESKFKLEKPLNEYKLFVSGATAKYKGETIYIIEVRNLDDTPTNCRLAFNKKDVYYFDSSKDEFIIVPKTAENK